MELLSDSLDRLADHEQLMIKQNMFELMQKDAIINLEREKREFQRILFFSIIAFLALLSLGFIIAFRQKYKDAQVLREKQNQILERNQALKEKNEELTILLQKLKAADEQIQLQHQQIIKHNEQLIEMVNVRTNEIGERATQITQFAFLVSHNMRGPVARILGLKNLIKLNPSREELDQILDRMGNSISEIEEIFSEIHELFDTRSNTGTRLELLDTKQLLNEIVEVMQEEIKMAKATVTLQLDRLPFFFSSLHDMKLIFTQLIINSLKFRSIERPCTITLEADIRNSSYYFSITDNGMGVDLSKHQNELFIPYKRFHRHVPGRGFNLFLIKNRIENLGGTIMMESKVNSYTKVTFILPRNSQS